MDTFGHIQCTEQTMAKAEAKWEGKKERNSSLFLSDGHKGFMETTVVGFFELYFQSKQLFRGAQKVLCSLWPLWRHKPCWSEDTKASCVIFSLSFNHEFAVR